MTLDRTEQCCGVCFPRLSHGRSRKDGVTTNLQMPSRSLKTDGADCANPAGQGRGNIMKIAKIEDLHCNAGWRDFSFLKITTDDGLVGWSEYNEGYGSAGLTAVIRRMAQDLIGHDPRPIERIMPRQYAITRQPAA